mmetsp:Transcript_106771/g.297180  ORF Transcript_106771/g.297180 Transcript_106771/m.297180 type:complete len:303 (-) Transcript_106771:244-1152(-)
MGRRLSFAHGQDGSCAVGNFEGSSLRCLASFVGEQDEAELRRRLREELGIDSEGFVAALSRSSAACRRGALLYPASEELAVSFNGGKDACVVLYLWLAALAAADAQDGRGGRLQVVYFDPLDEFVRVQSFVDWVVHSLNLHKITIQRGSFKEGMEDLVARGIRTVVMGQRRNDPWMAGVSAFTPSTDGWPAFMRINPIIDWSYSDVWTFLRGFGLPYCDLYDEGYTSLGSVNSTLPNPALRRHDGSYAPAYELHDEGLERAGRGSAGASMKHGGNPKELAGGDAAAGTPAPQPCIAAAAAAQ